MPSAVRFWHVLLMLACLGLGSGCSQLDLNKPIAWIMDAEDEPSAPNKVVAVWTDTILHRPSEPPARGFGGRLIFYGAKGDKPIRVEGSLLVYAFDEEGRSPTDAKPDRKYVFPPEQFAKHHSKSELGHSYSVWLPWSEVGGPQKEISLIVRFLPVEGHVVIGEQTRHLLPGMPKPAAAEHAKSTRQPDNDAMGQGPLRPVSYDATMPSTQNESEAAGSQTGQMETHTIPIPPRFGCRAPTAVRRPRITPRGSIVQQSAQAVPRGEQGAGPSAFLPGQTSPLSPRSTRFSPARSRALSGPTARLARDHAPWQPRPAKWPSYRQSTLPPATASESESASPAAPPGLN